MYLSTQCLYLISFCTLPTPVIFRVEQEKSSLPSIFHFPFKNCNNSLHFHLTCTSYIPFCFTTVSPFIAKSIISKLIFRRPNLSFSSTSMINNFEIDYSISYTDWFNEISQLIAFTDVKTFLNIASFRHFCNNDDKESIAY